ncbi:MAG: beta-ketoacyl-ACP synthase II [Bdellovibrionales bacterium]|nr:beta-ketoacyl-ACP synthase II [Bdellovibrionales bacterium]
METRVVVTGLGAITPVGLDVSSTWKAVLEGKSGIGPISLFNTDDCPVKFAGEVRGFDPTKLIGRFQPVSQKDQRRFGRFCWFGIAAGLQAYLDSGLDEHRSKPGSSFDPTRIGINIGVGMGGLPEIESVHEDFRTKGYRRISPFFIPQVIANMATGQLSIILDAKGPNLCNLTACASSAHSIGESYHQILRGDADVMLAGGAEAVISQLGIGGFAAMRALSTRNDAPEKASRPFDQDRDGFVMGEGAACLVLENYEHAKARGAKIYAELVGYGYTSDAYHMTSPAPEGEGGYRAMKMALKRAAARGIGAADIGYVNAHGTSTPAGDGEEAKAIAKVLEGRTQGIHVSSTKSMTGHLLGASGAAEALFSILAVRDQKIPPTINLDRLDPDCEATGLNFTPHRAVDAPIRAALSNSFGFGGTNASLIFSRI